MEEGVETVEDDMEEEGGETVTGRTSETYDQNKNNLQ